MKNIPLIPSLVCLHLALLCSCTEIQRSVAQIQSSLVSENPYPVAEKKAAAPVAKVAPKPQQSLDQWAPTLSKSQPSTSASKPATVTKPSASTPPSASKARQAAPAKQQPRPAAAKRPEQRKATSQAKPQAKPQPKKPTTAAKPTSAPKPAAKKTSSRIYTVRSVPGKPTHVYHPFDNNTIIRISPDGKARPKKGTIMRVPNQDIRFYVP